MKKTISILITLSMLFLINSCGKYEEGPKFSIKSKASRVATTWKLDEILINDEDQDIGYNQYYTMTLEKDGTGNQKNVEFTYENDLVEPASNYDLEWEFSSNKEKIKFFVKVNLASEWSEYYDIIKLKEKEMWLSENDTVHLHYVKTNEE